MDELDLPAELVIPAGEERRLRLPGLGTAGYVWQAWVEGAPGAVEVAVAPVADEDPSNRAAGGPVGRSFDEQVTVRGRHPGRVVVRLLQRRPWEQAAPPLREATLQVIVS